MKCPYCEQEHPDNLHFCTETGQQLPEKQQLESFTPDMKTCPNCLRLVSREMNFCTNCGLSFLESIEQQELPQKLAEESLPVSQESQPKLDEEQTISITPIQQEGSVMESIGQTRLCPNCQGVVFIDADRCNQCGFKFPEASIVSPTETPLEVEIANSGMKECPQCHQFIPSGMLFCTNCGTKFPEGQTPTGAINENPPIGDEATATRVCPKCNNIVAEDSRFCNRCGTSITNTVSSIHETPKKEKTKSDNFSLPVWAYFLAGAVFLALVALFLINRYPITAKRLLQFKQPTLAVQSTVDISQFISQQTPTNNPAVPVKTETAPAAVDVLSPTPTFGTLVFETSINEKDQAELVFVPAGSFLMGSDSSLDPYFWGAEGPSHRVTLKGYWIYRYEVTNAMYEACVKAGQCSRPQQMTSRTRKSYFGNPEYADYPVIYVRYGDANTYCHWIGGRLPTEAEWERAARGDTDDRIFPWGWEPAEGNQANFCDNGCPEQESDPGKDDGYRDTAPVGNYPDGVSPYGLYDVAGNVWEWVFDYFSPTYYQISPESNPRGPQSSTFRSIRGGGWNNPSAGMRVVQRYSVRPDLSLDTLGFRCAMDAN